MRFVKLDLDAALGARAEHNRGCDACARRWREEKNYGNGALGTVMTRILAGASSIFYGDKLLTTGNPDVERDRALMDKLGIRSLT